MDYRHSDLVGLYILTIIMLIVCAGTLSLARQVPERKVEIGSPIAFKQDSLRPD